MVVEAIKACTYAKPKEGIPAEDVAEFDGDDPYDGIRYMVDTVDRYFDDASDEFDRVKAQQALLAQLSNDRDWTAYYRNMHKLESEEKKIISVRRFR
jgi:hypothetical protein